jgi:hypothetical protein
VSEFRGLRGVWRNEPAAAEGQGGGPGRSRPTGRDWVSERLNADARSLNDDAKSLNDDAKSLNVDAKSLNVDAKSLNVDAKSLNAVGWEEPRRVMKRL